MSTALRAALTIRRITDRDDYARPLELSLIRRILAVAAAIIVAHGALLSTAQRAGR